MRLLHHILCTSWLLIQRNLCLPVVGSFSTTSRQICNDTPHSCSPMDPLEKTTSESSEDAYTAGSTSVAFVTAPNDDLAKKLAHGLVEQKLAACVNIVPQIQSIYLWEDKVTEDKEYLLMIKTRTSRVDELTKWVRENHSYSVAEVIALPIASGNLPYLNWITQTVAAKSSQ